MPSLKGVKMHCETLLSTHTGEHLKVTKTSVLKGKVV